MYWHSALRSRRRAFAWVAGLAWLCAGCGDSVTQPCQEWGGCFPGDVVVRVQVLGGLFPPREVRAGKPVWGPSDTIAVSIGVENQSGTAADSFTAVVAFGEKRRDHWSRIIEFSPHYVPPLQPGERWVLIDTAYIAPETRDTALHLSVRRPIGDAGPALNVRPTGDTILPVLSSGFELAMAGVPNQTMMQVWGRWGLWAKWRAHTTNQVLLRVGNPYELTLQPFQLTWCLIDGDYCPHLMRGDVPLTPTVPPGESRDMWIPFTLTNTDIRWFWDYVWGMVAICYPQWLQGTCAEFNVQLVPNFEAECEVPTIVPGQQVTDQTIDCDRTGSAYRFSARRGEQYRVAVTEGTAFIVGRDGKEQDEPNETQVTIPQDGDYYVILDQRTRLKASFTLLRLN